VTAVFVGASDAERLDATIDAFVEAGFERIGDLDAVRESDVVLGIDGHAAELLREADRRGIKYLLVHDGVDDGQVGGTYDRAHHRIDTARRREELAQHLRSRKRPLVTCLAFAYKNGAPSDAALVFDTRFLDNPYWVDELRPLTGRDAAVARYVMRQPEARRLVDDVGKIVADLVPLYAAKGIKHVVVAFGCSGGRHRSVVLAAELAQRLKEIEGIDVDFVTRDID
jgi:hypothetical protein